MYTWDNSDNSWHGNTIAWDETTGIGHFLKPKHHSTIGYELDWFNKGLVTEGIERVIKREKVDHCVAIGPAIMMKFVCKTTEPFGVKTIVSLNPIMIDGTGMCGGCRVTVGGETKFACVDGPDFDGHKVDFDELMTRNRFYRDEESHNMNHKCRLTGENRHA